MKEELKKKAIALRLNGHSIKQISTKLQISSSTASLWLRDVELNNAAQKTLIKRTDIARKIAGETNRKNKLCRISLIKDAARNEIAGLNFSKNQLKLLCSLIYYCEGAKNDSAMYFTNSDPELLKLFIKLLRGSFRIDESKFKVIVHIHEYHDWNKQKEYWSKILGIPKKNFYKPYLKKNTGKNSKEGYPGCVSLRYYDSNISRELLAYSREYFLKILRD